MNAGFSSKAFAVAAFSVAAFSFEVVTPPNSGLGGGLIRSKSAWQKVNRRYKDEETPPELITPISRKVINQVQLIGPKSAIISKPTLKLRLPTVQIIDKKIKVDYDDDNDAELLLLL